MDPFEVFQELFFDLALGPGANAVHQFKEQAFSVKTRNFGR
jgi:hypothetical protein